MRHHAKLILTDLGLNFSEAVNIFTSMVVSRRGLPFDVSLPNKETETVLNEVRAGTKIETFSLDELKPKKPAK
ncbi:MAG: type II toxin-antitoxin system RelB/DinJ family antitoxin [Gammaproteobacteria bacterium]|nr:type II toxin-antitoxin system RelB/DinJ family antitoxin [Gammaproteobacteria bacterium]